MKFLRAVEDTLLVVLVLLANDASAAGQAAIESEKAEKGITFYESIRGSSNTLGQVMKLDSALGYDFNKYFGIDFGIPVYLVRRSATTTSMTGTTTGASSATGPGNAYCDLRLRFYNPLVNFASTLEGTAPTGDTSKGLSTGRATFDWNNHLDHSFLGFTPFVNLGVANTVSDTALFTRPFTTLGLVGHFEGGASYRVWHLVSIGASAYDILPSGQQKVFSKLVLRQTTLSGAMSGRGTRGAFTNTSETTGGADIARDNGASAWLSASPVPFLDLLLAYTRSVPYNLNTVSFGVGFNLGYFIRKGRVL